jgi:hypothetical protein
MHAKHYRFEIWRANTYYMSLKIFADFLTIKNGLQHDIFLFICRLGRKEDKMKKTEPEKEKGYYIYPDLYEQPPEKVISRLLFPEKEEWQEQLIK